MFLGKRIALLCHNKILLYIFSRYLTYGIQFFNSIFIAVALGPVYFAIWGFINMILQYISQFNIGIPYSLNVLLSINKGNEKKTNSLFSASLFLYLFLIGFIVLCFWGSSCIDLTVISKYSFRNYSFYVLLISVLSHVNTLFTNYFRVINKLWEIVICQSILPIAMLISILVSNESEALLNLLLQLMIWGNAVSLGIYIFNYSGVFVWPKLDSIFLILHKGFYLFIYNASFYLILLSTRTIISVNYKVKEFGLFSFSFTLANTIMLLFDSFSFLIYPKTINKLNSVDKNGAIKIFNMISELYVTSVHFVMYIFIILFPLIILLFPKYNNIFQGFVFLAAALVLYTNCFVYSSFLTAKGKEKLLALFSFITLFVNILLGICFSKVLHFNYNYVVLSTIISYILYNLLLFKYSYKILGINYSLLKIIKQNYPLRLFLPFLMLLILTIYIDSSIFYMFLFLIYLYMNRNELYSIYKFLMRILKDSSIINI